MSAWCKGALSYGNIQIKTKKIEQIHGMEMYDFLYGFLLPELLSRDTILTWISPLYTTDRQRDRSELLVQADREAYIYPADIADLLNHKIWEKDSTFPEDKAIYLKNLGFLEKLTVRGGYDWWVPFSRKAMVFVAATTKMFLDVLKGEEMWSWYDDLRDENGSPFEIGSGWPRYEESDSNVKEAMTEMIRGMYRMEIWGGEVLGWRTV
ncbi:MAG: hypothetical protein L6R41_007256 [Letrouitia leprolyta]|nr:MAG: hypothetical protein L6R41_007256 [Letrouitia leprolyta]